MRVASSQTRHISVMLCSSDGGARVVCEVKFVIELTVLRRLSEIQTNGIVDQSDVKCALFTYGQVQNARLQTVTCT